MADEPQVIRGIDWKATFPFVSLFRGFRVAIHPSKLILALVALMLIYFGGVVLDGIWPQNHRAVPDELALYGASRASVKPKAEFYKSRIDARKEILDAHERRLKMIPDSYKNRSSLADIENYIHVELKREVAQINKAYDDLPADKKTDEERLKRDTQINRTYREAAEAIEQSRSVKGVGLFDTFCNHEIGMLNQMVAGVRHGNWLGTNGVADAIRSFFLFAPVWAIRHHPVFFTIFFLYFLCVWSVFGGAIARIAAVHVARDEKISIRQALRFSSAKFLSFLSAPIIPMLIVVAVGLVIAVGGFLANIPFIGPIIVGIFFFLALVAGFVMTLVLLGTGGGFNLMYPTIAVEGSDSFDAISRSFSYLYARPWRMAFYSGIAILYGSICYIFVRYFLFLMLTLTHKSVGLFVFTRAENAAPVWSAMWPSPTTLSRLTYDVDYLPLSAGQKIGAFLILVWVYLAIGLLGAFAISFYFSANTIIYFLMRHEVDATELDDVYLEQSDDEFAESAPAMTMTETTVATTTTVVAASGETAPPVAEGGSNGGASSTPPADSPQA